MAEGNGKDRSVDILENVLSELRGLRQDTNAQIGGLRQETREGLSRADARFERMEERVGRVETVLVETRQEMRGLRGEVQELRGDVSGLRGEVNGLRGELHEGFAELGAKIDSAAQRDRSLEKEVRELGQRVARLEARSEPE